VHKYINTIITKVSDRTRGVCVNSKYHLVRMSRASSGTGYEERVRISIEITEPVGFFSVKFFT